MKIHEIEKNIHLRLGIPALNAMQMEMAHTDARDILLTAPTGSGKTLAFAIRLLRAIDPKTTGQTVQGLVIAPSRELVLQIAEVIRQIATGLKVTPLYGGHRFDDEANSLSVVPDIVVATPGRLLDHINRRTVWLGGVGSLVLDEYDKSLELGFADEMRRIVAKLGDVKVRVLTSATVLPELPPFMGDGKKILFLDYSDRTSGAAKVPVVEVPSPIPDKLDTLSSLLASLTSGKAIVFANHRESAERIYERLISQGFPAGLYHGGLEQSQRRHAVQLLSNGSTPILVATDLAARGLDIPQVENIIHYHLPHEQSVWTHRNGRTARQGADGTVYAIVADGETLPEFIGFDRSFSPTADVSEGVKGVLPASDTIHINAGRKEKVSKGDILGFFVKTGGLDAAQVGTITVDDHEATVAVPRGMAKGLIERLRTEKLKGKRVRMSLLR